MNEAIITEHPKRDHSSIPKVEVVSEETSPDNVPILVAPDNKGGRRSKAVRVSWAESVRSNIKRPRWDSCVSVTVCVALMLAFGIGLLLIAPLMLFNSEPTSADDDFGTTFPMDNSLSGYLPPLNRERWSTGDADHSTPETFEVSPRSGKQNDSSISAQRTAVLVDELVHENRTIVNACMLDIAEAESEESFWSTRASSCGIVVECGYSIDKKMRLRPSAQSIIRNRTSRFTRAEQAGAGRSQSSLLLCVSIDEEALINAAADNEGQLSEFVRNVVLQLRSAKYEGICLRLTVTPTNGSGFLNAIRKVSDKLSDRNTTVSLLLPYGLPGRALKHVILQLVAVLGRPHAILFYPTPTLFRKKAKWPSRKDIAFLPPKTTANVCYLLPASAHAISLRGNCDVRKEQRIKNSRELTTVSDGCRLWNRSWTSARYAYYTYACYANAGILFQTPEQARRFREAVVRYAHPTCLGSRHTEWDSFPAMCAERK
ncbi:hypothetical protein MRX96_036233 [Rhipicephalus microplus]